MAKSPNRYTQILEAIFQHHYQEGMTNVPFERDEISRFAATLGIETPKNLGDLIYSFRYRTVLPLALIKTAPEGYEWVIRPLGRARYQFSLIPQVQIGPSSILAETKIPDSTPGVISLYSQNDEQALLAILRYNRLIDTFTGLTCYSLQSHLRTTVPEMGQVETDELYIGIDRQGMHYALPIQAKGGSDRIGIVQIEQDIGLCRTKFPLLICRPIAAQFMQNNVIALFECADTDDGIRVIQERHYRLVPPDSVTEDDLQLYRASRG